MPTIRQIVDGKTLLAVGTSEGVTKSWDTRGRGRTAAQEYQKSRGEVNGLLRQFEQHLQDHAQKASQEPRNWGYAGDLGHYREAINNIFGKPTSPVGSNVSAPDAYRANKQDLDGLIQNFKTHLDEHSGQATANPKDWGYVGDMNHYKQSLQELLPAPGISEKGFEQQQQDKANQSMEPGKSGWDNMNKQERAERDFAQSQSQQRSAKRAAMTPGQRERVHPQVTPKRSSLKTYPAFNEKGKKVRVTIPED